MVKRHVKLKTYKRNVHGVLQRVKAKKQRSGKGFAVHNPERSITHTPLLPLSKIAKLPYAEIVTFNTGSVNTGGFVFTANGLYDPNITGVGHQPMGFDQMMLFYEHYTVTNAKLTVTLYNYTSTESVMVGVLVAPDATIETNYYKLLENGLLTRKWLSKETNSNNMHTFTVSCNLSKVNGKKDVKSEDDFRGDIASNPPEQTYFHLFAYNQISTTICTVYGEVVIEYDAIFTEPRKMIMS